MSEAQEGATVETSPDGRYCRFSELLGTGAFKRVYKGVDTQTGVEIAWGVVELDRAFVDVKQLQRETAILSQIDHPNVVKFFDSWVFEEKMEVVFVTECMTGGTLKGYLSASRKTPRLKVIKGWCRNILAGLDHLHTRDPPIIHRDIKLDNIFTDQGKVKIGDLGLATNNAASSRAAKGGMLSVTGTPHFMAPEMYDEKYTTKVDIWAFGLAVLEMCTNAYPYDECEGHMQIMKKVLSGLLPDAFFRVEHKPLQRFISLCLRPADERPSAGELLVAPFFDAEPDADDIPVKVRQPNEMPDRSQPSDQPAATGGGTAGGTTNASGAGATRDGAGGGGASIPVSGDLPTLDGQMLRKSAGESASAAGGTDVAGAAGAGEAGEPDKESTSRRGTATEGPIIMALSLASKTGAVSHRKINFSFDLEKDTPEDFAQQLTRELGLPASALEPITRTIDAKAQAARRRRADAEEACEVEVE